MDTLTELAQINAGEAPETAETEETGAAPGQEPASEPIAAAPGQEPPAAPEPGANTDDVTPEPATPAVVYDGQNFASEKDAFDYAQKKLSEVETGRLIAEARNEAFQDAAAAMGSQVPASQAMPATAEPEFDEDAYYSDPAGYLKSMREKMTKEIGQSLKSDIAQQQADDKLWNEFFTANPDLQGYKTDCEMMLNQHTKTIELLAKKDKTKAMEFLATKTREKFQTWAESQLPHKTLSNAKAGPSSGNAPGVTPTQEKNTTEPLDFVSELRNMNA
jgi:hypothetical protein